jgi:hypothetical protein
VDVEFEVERFKGGVDQTGQYQHEKAIQQFPPNWFHLFLCQKGANDGSPKATTHDNRALPCEGTWTRGAYRHPKD